MFAEPQEARQQITIGIRLGIPMKVELENTQQKQTPEGDIQTPPAQNSLLMVTRA